MPDTDHDHKTVEPFHGPIRLPPDPVDVEIVGVVDVKVKPERDWQPFVAVANANEPVRIVGANPRRRSVVIINAGPGTIYLIPDRNGNATTGVPIAALATVTMEHQKAIYFLAPSATQAAQVVVNGWAESEVASAHK